MRPRSLYTTGDNTFILPGSGGLNSGMWKHHISTNVGGNQHQQKPVLFTSTAADYTTLAWTYHPTVIKVNVTGDAAGGSCSSSCTLRQALTKANNLIGAAPAILIQFALPVPTTLTMTNSADLAIGNAAAGAPIITIDGTDSNGNPWIVGDALAAAQGSQDSFPFTLDLNNVTKLKVNGDNVTIKGLEIKNTVSSGNPTQNLIQSDRDNLRLEALRLDGGAAGTCSPNCGNLANHLIALTGNGSEIVNVEGRAGYGNGADLIVGTHLLRDSWLHHNFGNSVAANVVEIERNTLELSGRRLSDDVEVYTQAAGIMSSGTADFATHRNLVRNNGGDGIQVNATGLGTELTDDYICGNGAKGASVTVNINSVSIGTGLAATYNGSGGVRFTGSSTAGASATFRPPDLRDSALTR